jgi:hypothetical protein
MTRFFSKEYDRFYTDIYNSGYRGTVHVSTKDPDYELFKVHRGPLNYSGDFFDSEDAKFIGMHMDHHFGKGTWTYKGLDGNYSDTGVFIISIPKEYSDKTIQFKDFLDILDAGPEDLD